MQRRRISDLTDSRAYRAHEPLSREYALFWRRLPAKENDKYSDKGNCIQQKNHPYSGVRKNDATECGTDSACQIEGHAVQRNRRANLLRRD